MYATLLATGWTGSPPPVRGKAQVCHLPVSALRITPACAGKSERIAEMLKNETDLPRLCGEKVVSTPRVVSAAGSPPPVRGKDGSKWDIK